MEFNDILIKDADSYIFERQNPQPLMLEAIDYKQRISILVDRVFERKLDFVFIYGDREHFSNIEYFTGFDCRFEEALLVVSKEGELNIIVGNEGIDACRAIPFDIRIHLYQNFSLQGQPRETCMDLANIIIEKIRISHHNKIGLVGWKYFEKKYFKNSDRLFDIPAYLLEILYSIFDKDNITNFTEEITGLPHGIRMKLYAAKEVAIIEQKSIKVATVLLNIIKNLKEGDTELESSINGKIDFSPISVHGVVNFGEENVRIGLRSPDNSTLKLGSLCGLCYGVRGSLIARNGVALYSDDFEKNNLESGFTDFYKKYWSIIAKWYEIVKLNANAGDIYKTIKSEVIKNKFTMALNPGHYIGADEWTNTPFYENSSLSIPSGAHLQCDIICTVDNPFKSAICEDTIVIADKELLNSIKNEYPLVAGRIAERQEKMRSVLGIDIDNSLLPMSNLNAVYFPFMLNYKRIFAKKCR